jgi:hypothetical protein
VTVNGTAPAEKYCLTKDVGGFDASVVRPAIDPAKTGTTENDKRLRGDVFLGTCSFATT